MRFLSMQCSRTGLEGLPRTFFLCGRSSFDGAPLVGAGVSSECLVEDPG